MMRYSVARVVPERGFTLIELMVSMVVAMVLLAGLYSVFIMQSRVQNAQSEVVAGAEDLRTVAQIMQAELRMSTAITYAADTITYTPLDPPVVVACGTGTFETDGHFQYGNADVRTGTPKDAIWWKRPGSCLYQQMVRGLQPSNVGSGGFQVSASGSGWNIILATEYQDHEHQSKNWTISFDVWPRNN